MKEEELMKKHDNHKSIYIFGNKYEETTNHNNKIVNGVQESRLRF
jgi:hypothetical protein